MEAQPGTTCIDYADEGLSGGFKTYYALHGASSIPPVSPATSPTLQQPRLARGARLKPAASRTTTEVAAASGIREPGEHAVSTLRRRYEHYRMEDWLRHLSSHNTLPPVQASNESLATLYGILQRLGTSANLRVTTGQAARAQAPKGPPRRQSTKRRRGRRGSRHHGRHGTSKTDKEHGVLKGMLRRAQRRRDRAASAEEGAENAEDAEEEAKYMEHIVALTRLTRQRTSTPKDSDGSSSSGDSSDSGDYSSDSEDSRAGTRRSGAARFAVGEQWRVVPGGGPTGGPGKGETAIPMQLRAYLNDALAHVDTKILPYTTCRSVTHAQLLEERSLSYCFVQLAIALVNRSRMHTDRQRSTNHKFDMIRLTVAKAGRELRGALEQWSRRRRL